MILVRIRNVRKHSADMIRRCPVSQVSKNIPKYVQLISTDIPRYGILVILVILFTIINTSSYTCTNLHISWYLLLDKGYTRLPQQLLIDKLYSWILSSVNISVHLYWYMYHLLKLRAISVTALIFSALEIYQLFNFSNILFVTALIFSSLEIYQI